MSSAGSHKMKTYTAATRHIRDGENIIGILLNVIGLDTYWSRARTKTTQIWCDDAKLFLVRMQHNRHIRYTSNEIVRQPLNLANDFYLSEAILNFLPKYS